jgi:hypothetical protein
MKRRRLARRFASQIDAYQAWTNAPMIRRNSDYRRFPALMITFGHYGAGLYRHPRIEIRFEHNDGFENRHYSAGYFSRLVLRSSRKTGRRSRRTASKA